MFSVFRNRSYRHLFLAQVIALVGTGLATVALGLLAFDLAGDKAGTVLGTALAIKMIAYIGVAPIASAFSERLPRRTTLVTLDLIRAAVAISLPFVTQIWQIYILIFVLQSASAAFTPTFQATIPDVLPEEDEYTKALSLSRLAYDLESVVSPMLAAALVSVISFTCCCGNFNRIHRIRFASGLRRVAKSKAITTPRHLRSHDQGPPDLPGYAPIAWPSGTQSSCCCGERDGDCQHRGVRPGQVRVDADANCLGSRRFWWRLDGGRFYLAGPPKKHF